GLFRGAARLRDLAGRAKSVVGADSARRRPARSRHLPLFLGAHPARARVGPEAARGGRGGILRPLMERMGEIARIRLEAGKANAMSAQLLDAIDRAFDEFQASEAAAAIVTGYDRFFSAGLALPALVDLDRPAMKRFIERFGAVMERVFRCARPVVAAVNGHAIAGGCVLFLQADWRICADGDF